ncbi:MAG: amino acid permease [Coriobacteriia bacterium]|nr:amino acid permease [Coriobacteriia bacterium]
MSENQQNSGTLGRKLGLSAVIALGVGSTIGTGIFSTMSEVALAAGSSLFLVLAFFIGALLQLPASFCYSELSSAYPEDGGYYVYLREAGSRPLAFLCGWVCFWATDPPSVSIMALGLVNYLSVLLPFDNFVLRMIAVGVILIFMFLHLRSVKAGGIFQICITILKLLPFIIIIGFGIFFINQELFMNAQISDGFHGQPGFIALFAAISATTFAFDGMYSPCYLSGEVKNPRRVLPIGLIATAIIILLLYTGLTMVSTGMLSIDQIANSPAPIALVASQIPFIGHYAGLVVAIMAVLVILGSMSSAIMYQPRIEYAMAKDGYFFKVFGIVSKKYNTPSGAIIAHCMLIILLTFVGNLTELLGYFTLVSLIKNLMAISTIVVLRKKEGYNPFYRAPLGWLFPIIAIVMNLILIIVTFIAAPIGGVVCAVAMIATGLPAYYFWNRRKTKNNE